MRSVARWGCTSVNLWTPPKLIVPVRCYAPAQLRTRARDARRLPAIWQAAAVVQSRSVQGVSTTSVSLAFSSNVIAGSAIIVCCSLFGTSAFTVGGCADNRGGTYTRDVSNFDGAHSIGVAMYSAPNVAGGATTVTVSGLASGSYPTIAIFEVSGLLASAIFDVGASNTGSAAAHPTGTTVTTAQADEIAFAVDTHGGGTSTPTINNSFTIPAAGQGLETNSANEPLGTAYKVLSATGTQTATWTWQNAQFASCIGTYKAASVVASLILNPIPRTYVRL